MCGGIFCFHWLCVAVVGYVTFMSGIMTSFIVPVYAVRFCVWPVEGNGVDVVKEKPERENTISHGEQPFS